MARTSATFTFMGLLVFRRDPHTEHYEVGILRAREAHHGHPPHFLQIEIKPDDGTACPIPQEVLEGYIQGGNVRWQLDVEGTGSSPPGVHARRDKPHDRKGPTRENDTDLGWMINIENDEFHNSRLRRARNALQPIIRLKHGRLFTSCKTDSVDTIQCNGEPRHFGFITGAVSLTIDTSDGQEPVLNFVNRHGEKVEIFRLPRTNEVSYHVSILNTPLKGTTPVGGHFSMYYDLLFKDVPVHERFDLKVHKDSDHPIPPPRDRCPEPPDKSTPDPFKCGGILVEGADPLE